MPVADQASATRPGPLGAGYLALVRGNRDFRNLWLGQIVSELGDWFALVALFNLLLDLTDRAQSVSWLLIIMHLPSLVVGPVAGALVDRFDRKRIMIASDLARTGLVLCYLLVRRADQVWIVYLVAALENGFVGLFEPARNASLPNICRREDVAQANVLSSLTWSVMLTVGAGLGGLLTAAVGRDAAFVIDAASFALSAWLIRRVAIPPHPARPPSAETTAAAGLREVREGLAYLARNRRVLALVLVKTGWCLGGGLQSVLGVFGQKIFPILGSGAAGIGTLFAARGIGTAIGPVVARRLGGGSREGMVRWIGAAYFLGCVFYVAFGWAPGLGAAAAALMAAHMGGSITWVFSTVLLQLDVPDRFRGRVFAIDFALLTLAVAASNYAAGYALDVLALDPRWVATAVGGYFALPGCAWFAARRLLDRRPDAPPESVPASPSPQ